MKRIIRLTESDLTRIVRRVISEGQRPNAKDYYVKETQTNMGMGTNLYNVTSIGTPTQIKDGNYKSFSIPVNYAMYYYDGSNWGTNGKPDATGTENLYHRCGAKANLFGNDDVPLSEITTGSAGFASKMGGSLETASNNWCNKMGVKNQSSIGTV
jgi:hypothetical protein